MISLLVFLLAFVPAVEPVSTAETLDRIAVCESGRDYGAVSLARSEIHFDGRRGSFGAYQFGRATWDWVAGDMGWHVWVGVRPDRVPPIVQDLVAAHLLWLERTDNQEGDFNYSWAYCGRWAASGRNH